MDFDIHWPETLTPRQKEMLVKVYTLILARSRITTVTSNSETTDMSPSVSPVDTNAVEQKRATPRTRKKKP